MGDCRQITGAAFVHLRGIQTLDLGCNQITDAAFVHLRGIQSLDMRECLMILDATFVHLRGLQTLDMYGCNQATITGATLVHLRRIRVFTLECRPALMAAAAAVLALGPLLT